MKSGFVQVLVNSLNGAIIRTIINKNDSIVGIFLPGNRIQIVLISRLIYKIPTSTDHTKRQLLGGIL